MEFRKYLFWDHAYVCDITKDFDCDLFPLRIWFFFYFLTQGRKKGKFMTNILVQTLCSFCCQ